MVVTNFMPARQKRGFLMWKCCTNWRIGGETTDGGCCSDLNYYKYVTYVNFERIPFIFILYNIKRKEYDMKSEVAKCAQAIRKELKSIFPHIKFEIHSRSYSGGCSVDVRYINGVPTESVEKVVRKYEYGSFDGMTDCYNYDNSRSDIPQAKYVLVQREISNDVYSKVEADIAKNYGLENPSDENEWFKKFGFWKNSVVSREIREMTF